jgi:aldose 1-epimerase
VDFTLRVTYKLLDDRLVVEATVESNSPDALPFGLGYHPYFRLPSLKERSIDNYVLTANMNAHWETVDQLPTGSRNPIPRRLDFRTSRTIGLTELDDVLTDAVRNSSSPEGLTQLASLAHPDAPISIQILADGSFRELVLFTPPHREAIAIEPYTCSPDAPNLAKRGMDSGWREVLPGEKWEGAVEYRVGKVD